MLALCRFPAPGTAVTCAVSGGVDSLALLVLASRAGLGVTAVHVDHGLRPDSAAEAHVVAAAAERFGARFEAVRVTVAPGPNLEARARAARRAALPRGALTAHTADDQAETVLLNLLRGAGVDGLAGIRSGPTKPLLGIRRRDTEWVCQAAGLAPVRDPSNDDLSFRRNRVRHELVPLLDDIAGRDVSAVLARSAGVLRGDADLLDELAQAVDVTDAAALARAPQPLARRAVRRWLTGLTGTDEHHPPDLAAVDRVLAVARGEAVACEVAGGVRIRRSGGRLTVRGE